jgi:imidazolonepropionase-like amidohydrolase
VGTLAPGAYADLIALERNPLDDIRALENVSFVMKGGIVHLAEPAGDAPPRKK